MAKNKYIKHLLMCRPDYFRVDYSINPWMKPGSVNQGKANSQWNELLKAILKSDINVDIIKQKRGLTDMVFSADQGIIKIGVMALSNFHHPQRKKETEAYLPHLKKLVASIYTIDNSIDFEGSGDAIPWNDKIFLGTGERTSGEATAKLASIFNTRVIPLRLVNPYFYHLDTCLLFINQTTAFFFPEAFDPRSQEILKKLIPNLLPLLKNEAYCLAANSLITDHQAIIPRAPLSFANKLRALNYRVTTVDVSEFIKAGGGIHCLTQTIQEKYE